MSNFKTMVSVQRDVYGLRLHVQAGVCQKLSPAIIPH